MLFSGIVRSNLDYFKQVPENKLKEAVRRVKLLAEEGKPGLFTLDSPIITRSKTTALPCTSLDRESEDHHSRRGDVGRR